MPALRPSRMKTLWPGAVALALLVSGLGPEARATTPPETAARTQATQAVTGVGLPAGATRLSRRPSPDIGAVPAPDNYPTSVVLARWYAVPGHLATTLTQVKAHPPTGWLLEEDTETGSPAVLVFAPLDGGAPSPSRLVVTAAQHGARVDVGVVADVLWLPLRTPLETLPHAATSATVAYTGPIPAGYQGPQVTRAHKQLTLSDTQARSLAAALNQTPLTLPYTGAVTCPPDFGERVTTTFSYGGHHVTFTVAPAGCPSVTVRADGALQPRLDPNLGLYRELTRLLHRTIPWTQR